MYLTALGLASRSCLSLGFHLPPPPAPTDNRSSVHLIRIALLKSLHCKRRSSRKSSRDKRYFFLRVKIFSSLCVLLSNFPLLDYTTQRGYANSFTGRAWLSEPTTKSFSAGCSQGEKTAKVALGCLATYLGLILYDLQHLTNVHNSKV